jgi:hypothetical protein
MFGKDGPTGDRLLASLEGGARLDIHLDGLALTIVTKPFVDQLAKQACRFIGVMNRACCRGAQVQLGSFCAEWMRDRILNSNMNSARQPINRT